MANRKRTILDHLDLWFKPWDSKVITFVLQAILAISRPTFITSSAPDQVRKEVLTGCTANRAVVDSIFGSWTCVVVLVSSTIMCSPESRFSLELEVHTSRP